LNFFEAQDRARRNTFLLVLLFIIAVIGLVLLSNLLLLVIISFAETSQFSFDLETNRALYSWKMFFNVSMAVSMLIFFGSLFKSLSLAGGGTTVAEMLGGRLIPQGSSVARERRLLNVVEEMAIAAGMPIPKVYLLNDRSINAFAAGKSPADAVIGVTEGTLSRLTRDELQGVIAHEFSHIFNGDMRLNMRLIGVLHGILLIGLIGYFLLRSLRHTSSRNSKAGGGIAAIAALGLGMMVIGYTGTFFGQWIKASVSRQREYLADSSAVQFTRNKDSIAGALKKIGGGSDGSYLNSPAAPQYSHAYFATGVRSFLGSMFATHPPLEDRINRVDPHWDGEYVYTEAVAPLPPESLRSRAPASQSPLPGVEKIAVATAILSSAEQAISQVGTLNEENIAYVHELIIAMPAILRTAAQDAFSARALVYAILVHNQKHQDQVWSLLMEQSEKGIPELTKKYLPELINLEPKFRLPLLELSINALRELSPPQFLQFKQAVHQIIVSDNSVDLKEWIILRLVFQQLDMHFGVRKPPKPKHANLGAFKSEVETILALIAYVEHKGDDEARAAFEHGSGEAGIENLKMPSRRDFSLKSLDRALDNLMELRPLVKPRLLKACVAIILADGKPTTRGRELVRTISSCLDCPMPPLLV
jgi:Zn-dependent protease with chaperone function